MRGSGSPGSSLGEVCPDKAEFFDFEQLFEV